MSGGQDLRTKALVLRRTNYGETDRILNLLTPEGKMSVLAKGVRKEKSKLAGGVEMFTLSEIVVHQGKSGLGVLTSAKMLEFYDKLLTDLDRLETASEILKRVDKKAEVAEAEYFEIAAQSLKALNTGADAGLVQAWFYLNLARVSGEQINLLYDTDGEKLEAELKYTWDRTESALRKNLAGKIGVNEIKLMRLMLTAKLSLILKVAGAAEMAPEILYIAKATAQV